MQLSQNDIMADDGSERKIMEKIDINNQRFPYCIVWTPIPLLTWLVRYLVKYLRAYLKRDKSYPRLDMIN